MNGDRTSAGTDDELVDLLRRSLNVLPADVSPSDTPPESVIEGAIWVHDWLNMDAELAELTFDSTDDVELAGVRSTGSLRELTFVSGSHTIELEIEPGRRSVDVSGTIAPTVAGTMQFVVGGEIFAGTIDDAGAFSVVGVAHGTVLAFVDVPTGKIRLGSFEV